MNANDMTADDLVLSLYLQQHREEAPQTEYAPSNNGSLSTKNDFLINNLQLDRPHPLMHDPATSSTTTLQQSTTIKEAINEFSNEASSEQKGAAD